MHQCLMFQLLKQPYKMLCAACKKGDNEVVKALLDAHIAVNYVDVNTEHLEVMFHCHSLYIAL